MDTAVKTSNSGYLQRLVCVLEHAFVCVGCAALVSSLK